MSYQIIKDKNSDVILGNGCRYQLPELLNAKSDISSIIVICDENTRVYCLPLLKPVLDDFITEFKIIELPAGEKTKSVDSFNMLVKELIKLNVDRKSLILNVGGGVITDLGAYVATTFKRGLRFINIPTSLIGQLDAAIGGKTGINFNKLKNILGTFSSPEYVICDLDFLQTLAFEEFRSTFPEILKYGLIHDTGLYKQLCTDCIQETEQHILDGDIIRSCIESKLYFVNKDLYDLEDRNALNLGHTIGHAIESISNGNPRPLLHGEAVGIGMICSLYISCKLLGLDESVLMESQNFILKNTSYFDIDEREEKILEIMQHDKKNESGQIKFTLIRKPGHPVVKQSVDFQTIKESLDYYKSIGK